MGVMTTKEKRKLRYAMPVADELRLDNRLQFMDSDGSYLRGTETVKSTSATAGKKFMQMYVESTATSDDARANYTRLYIAGAGGGGEALRAYTSVMANAVTAHGAHISLGFDAVAGGSECSGLGAAVRGTLHIPAVASWAPAGTLCAGMFEIYSDGDTSDPAGLTELSVLRLVNGGNATGAADIDDDAFLLSVQGFTAGAAHTWVTGITVATMAAATSCALKIKVGSTTYWIPVATAIA